MSEHTPEKKVEEHSTDKCYLIYGEDGRLHCMHNHPAGEECLALTCEYCGKFNCECYTPDKKAQVEAAVEKAVKDYGPALRALGNDEPPEKWEDRLVGLVQEFAWKKEQVNGFQPYGYTDEEKEKKIYFDGYKDGRTLLAIDLATETKKGDSTLRERLVALVEDLIAQAKEEARHSLRAEIEGKIEQKYGKKGTMSGSFGFQGIKMGVEAYQTPEDKLRDDILQIIHRDR